MASPSRSSVSPRAGSPVPRRRVAVCASGCRWRASAGAAHGSTLTSTTTPAMASRRRLQPGVRTDQTRPTVQAIAHGQSDRRRFRGPRSPPPTWSRCSPQLLSAIERRGTAFGRTSDLADLPVLVLLITCTNVSSAPRWPRRRTPARIAVRLPLGAERRRVVRRLVTGTVHAGVGRRCIRPVHDLGYSSGCSTPAFRTWQFEVDWRSIAFGLALVAGVLDCARPCRRSPDAAGGAQGFVRRHRLATVGSNPGWSSRNCLHAARAARHGRLLLEMRSDLRQLRAQPHADRLLELRFNVNRATVRSTRNAANARPRGGATRGGARRRRRRAARAPRFS